jgi:hypothetical protein
MSAALPYVLTGEDVNFEHDDHAYIDSDGITRRMSVTQAIKIAGLIDYSMVPPDVLANAAARGRLVHQASAILDRGDSLEFYEIPDVCEPYIEAYALFAREMSFVADPGWIEKPMIVELFGHRVGMTPDAVGWIDSVPTVVERKATASAHPSWAIQTAGYELGLRAAGVQIRQRIAVQLLPTGKYRPFFYENEGDHQTFADAYRLAAWKVKHNLAKLA